MIGFTRGFAIESIIEYGIDLDQDVDEYLPHLRASPSSILVNKSPVKFPMHHMGYHKNLNRKDFVHLRFFDNEPDTEIISTNNLIAHIHSFVGSNHQMFVLLQCTNKQLEMILCNYGFIYPTELAGVFDKDLPSDILNAEELFAETNEWPVSEDN